MKITESHVMQFGKYKGKTILEILDIDSSYLIWLKDKNIIEIPIEILSMCERKSIEPDIEDLHNDWGAR